jgi:PAS domain S-box-containing protein
MTNDLETRADVGGRRSTNLATRIALVTDGGAPNESEHREGSGLDWHDAGAGSAGPLRGERATVRRSGPAPIIAGDLEIDVRARRVWLHGKPVAFTTREFDLLAFLAAHEGLVFSRADLLREVWHSEPDWQQAATVTEHVRRLRTKIEREPHAPQMLKTVRSVGYRFDLPAHGGRPVPQLIAAPGLLIEIDGEIVSADQDAAALFGVADAGELIGRSVIDLLAPSWGLAFCARKNMIGCGGSPRSQVVGVVTVDGSEVLAEISSSPTEWLGLPARKKALVPLRTNADPFRRLVTGLFSDVTDAVIVTDTSLHIWSWNGSARALYGWSKEEVIGRHLGDVIPWSGETSELLRAWEELDDSGRWHGEGHQFRRDGTEIAVRVSITQIADDRGTPVAVVAVNRPLRPVVAPGRRSAEQPMTTASDIRRGLADGEFVVYYQPIVSLTDGQLLTVQALLRWEHPRHGILLPRQFLSRATNDDVRSELTGFVLEEACRSASGWNAAGLDVGVSVELPAQELCDPSVADRLGDLLTDSRLDPARLWIEVAERSVVADVESTQRVFRTLSDLGIGVTIARFGSGSASLVYLRELSFDAIKIDAALIAGVAIHASDRAVVRSMVALGAEIGVFVVADGVETRAQARTLAAIGCTIGQGDLYGGPVPAEQLGRANAHRSRPMSRESSKPGAA